MSLMNWEGNAPLTRVQARDLFKKTHESHPLPNYKSDEGDVCRKIRVP